MGLSGRVIIVAGKGERLDKIVPILVSSDAFVAVVSSGSAGTAAHAWFRVDADDPDVWSRVVPHVEQRLGPIDAAAATKDVHSYVRQLLEPDMRRRGHGGVVDLDAAADVDDAVRMLETLL